MKWDVRAGDVTNQEAIKPAQTKLSLAFCVFTSTLGETVLVLFSVVCQYLITQKWRASNNKLLECARYTRSLCCLFGRGACTVSAREHSNVLPLWTLRSRLAFFHNEGAQARVPQGSGPAVAKEQRMLQSLGSQMDLSAELETGTLNNEDTGSALNRSFRSVKRI